MSPEEVEQINVSFNKQFRSDEYGPNDFNSDKMFKQTVDEIDSMLDDAFQEIWFDVQNKAISVDQGEMVADLDLHNLKKINENVKLLMETRSMLMARQAAFCTVAQKYREIGMLKVTEVV